MAIVRSLSLARDLEAIARLIRTGARTLTRADGATLILRDGDSCLYLDQDPGGISPPWKGRRLPMGQCISGWVMRQGQPAVVPNIHLDNRLEGDHYTALGIRSLVMVPIHRQSPVGAIGCYWGDYHQPGPTGVRLQQALADVAAVAIENVRLSLELEGRVRDRTAQLTAKLLKLQEEMAHRQATEARVLQLSMTDELTGLANRRGLVVRAARLVNQGHSHGHGRGRVLCLLYLDLDGLKLINDRFGHQAGDRAIMDAAKLLRETFRGADAVARLGGDEFVVMVHIDRAQLPRADVLFRKRLRDRLDALNRLCNRPYPLSMSLGIAYQQGEELDLEGLLAQADAQMYARKRHRAGRTTVQVGSPDGRRTGNPPMGTDSG